MSIRFRLFLTVAFLGIFGFYSLVYWILGDLRQRYLATMEESMVDTATVLSSVVSNEMVQQHPETELLRYVFQDASARRFKAQIYEFQKDRINIRVYVTDEDGICVFDSNNGEDEGKNYSRWNDVIRTLRGEYGARSSEINPEDPSTSTMYVASPILYNGRIVGVLTVYKPSGSIDTFLQTAKKQVIFASLIVALAVILIGIFSTFWVTRPVQKLTQYANQIRDGSRPELPALGHNEMGMLGQAFEEMRISLEGKQYIENYIQTLTHEMKSPLSAIRGAAELMDEEMPVAHRRKFLGNIRSETQRLEDLVQRLLELAALEKRRELQTVENIDVVLLVKDVVSSMTALALEKQILFDLNTQSACVQGERFLLRQAVTNLVKNAMEFSPRDSAISISVTKIEGCITIDIKDSGAGIPDFALDKIFDRFFSLERPATGHKSTGLGLPFVKEVTALHHGSITVLNRSDKGVLSRLSIPCVQPERT